MRRDRSEFISPTIPLGFEIIFRLHVQKPLRVDIEKLSKPQRDIRRDALSSMANLIDAAAWYMDRLCERVNGQLHRIEKLFA